uniref:Saposin B-type domain-containing protein n=1 Tax=Nelumbo nucifera TaxID=4432 RepID=A0A822ZKK1_NELNU|nr:TPA_asm: hypothetical protein HUJ06_002195 [Nelumbo nucifera]
MHIGIYTCFLFCNGVHIFCNLTELTLTSMGLWPSSYAGISIKGGVTSTFRGSEVSASRVLPSTELSSDLICFSCLEASRMVEKVLNDPELPDKISMLRNEVCHVLPTDLRVKCDEILEMYTNQAIVFLQVYFSEENLCNSTGLCPSDSDILKVASLGKGQQLPEVEPMHDLTSKLVKRLSMSHESTDKVTIILTIAFFGE